MTTPGNTPSSLELNVLDPKVSPDHARAVLTDIFVDQSDESMKIAQSLIGAALRGRGKIGDAAADFPWEMFKSSESFDKMRLLFADIFLDDSEGSRKATAAFILAARAGMDNALRDKSLQEINKILDELKSGPVRKATFMGLQDRVWAEVFCEDGTTRFPVIPDPGLIERLARGDQVRIDANGEAILSRISGPPNTGPEGKFVRRIGAEHVEISFRDNDPCDQCVMPVSARLQEKLDAGEVSDDARLLIGRHQRMAFDIVPTEKRRNRYMYADTAPLPEVSIERDIGAPHPCIAKILAHVRREMFHPEIARKYRRRRCLTMLLAGVSGSGKTLSIQGVIRAIAEMIATVLNLPVEDVPSRVLRMSMDKVLSEWLGRSDKQLARYFDEVSAMYDEPFITPDGREIHLPVIPIGEEIEALSRVRGGDHEGVYDRIQSVALQRLDMTRPEFQNKLVIFLFTTNMPQLVDPAFIRRAGGTVETFGRVHDPKAFQAILNKHLRGLPISSENGYDQDVLLRRMVDDTTSWLFSPNGHDSGQVELSFAGAAAPAIRYRRDFLTGGLIDRVVQEAGGEACLAEESGCRRPGLTLAELTGAFDNQIRSIVNLLDTQNAGYYVDIPDGARTTNVRRLDAKPSELPFELMTVL